MLTCTRITERIVLTLGAGTAVVLALSLYTSATAAESVRNSAVTAIKTNFTEVGFIKTGLGTHGLYPSRDGTKLYVANRGINKVFGPPRRKGSVPVIDFVTNKVLATWPVPRGGSPDMGNVSADGKQLWLSGRFDNVVYDIDTTTGEMKSIPVGKEPHGSRSGPSRVVTPSAIPGTCVRDGRRFYIHLDPGTLR